MPIKTQNDHSNSIRQKLFPQSLFWNPIIQSWFFSLTLYPHFFQIAQILNNAFSIFEFTSSFNFHYIPSFSLAPNTEFNPHQNNQNNRNSPSIHLSNIQIQTNNHRCPLFPFLFTVWSPKILQNLPQFSLIFHNLPRFYHDFDNPPLNNLTKISQSLHSSGCGSAQYFFYPSTASVTSW